MKRILQVISTLEQGGTEAVVLNYLMHMEEDKTAFDFLVIWGEKKGFYEDFLLSRGCEIYKMQNPPNKFLAHGKELKSFFRHKKYDVVHIHAMSSLRYRVAKVAKKSGVKNVIYHSHNSSNEKHLFLHNLLKSRLNKWCDYKFACSDIAGQYMYNGDFRVIHNAIDINRFAFNKNFREELRARYGLENKYIIGHIGRLSKVKNQQFLLKVLMRLVNNRKDAVLFCIGEGNDREALHNFAETNGLLDYVVFAGTVGTEVYKYYSMFDALAFPSLYEGMSVVLMEAQANGLPIVTSDKITKESKITENFQYLPIDENEETYCEWMKTICRLAEQRKNNEEILANAGYDIRCEAKKLQNFYLSCGQ